MGTFFLALRILYITTLLVSCLFALRYGTRTERQGAAIMFVGSMLTLVVEQPQVFDWRYARGGLLALDILVLVAFFALMARSNRFWPIWATACHLIAVTTHIVILIEPERVLQAYAIMQGFWAYPMLLAIVVGAEHQRRQTRAASVAGRSWTESTISPTNIPHT